MWRLHQKQFGVAGKMPDSGAQEIAEGRMIGVKHDNQVATREFHAIVHVASFGVLILVAGQIVSAQCLAQGLQAFEACFGSSGFFGIFVAALLCCATVIQQPHLQFVTGIIHRQSSRHGGRQNFLVFIVCWNEHIDGGQLVVRIARQSRALQRIDVDNQADGQDQHTISFGQKQNDSERKIDWIRERRQCAGDAPINVTDHHHCRETEKNLPPEFAFDKIPHDRHRTDNDDAHIKLG